MGALWWSLTLPGELGKEYCHKLGMGKPLGMGAVKLTPNLLLSQRSGQNGRYGQLFSGSTWHLAEQAADAAPYVQQFEKYVLTAAGLPGAQRLMDAERIRMLLAMLEWREGTETWLSATSYMEVEAGPGKVNEYKERPVLPDPLEVIARQSVVNGTLRNLRSRVGRGTSTPALRSGGAAAPSSPAKGGTRTGEVTRWNVDKAYGFITPDGGGDEVFVHVTGVTGGKALQKGQQVRFEIGEGPKGPQAKNVRPT